MASPDISLRELISIHRYTPFDVFDICFGSTFRRLDNTSDTHFPICAKTEDYQRLISLLSETSRSRDAERVCHIYMQSLCGRVQIMEAHRRGLLTDELYQDLQKTHSFSEAFYNYLGCQQGINAFASRDTKE